MDTILCAASSPTARVAEELNIMQAEKEDGTWDAAYAQGQATQEFTGPFAGMTPPAHRFAMTEEEWKNSEYYIPTFKFRPDMTVTRARIMKENYDQRRYLENVVSRGDAAYGLGMKALGFGASLVGSLFDPVNIIPSAGGVKAASVGRGMAKGALEGAAGNALADALVLPDLAAKGEDVGFADALLDTAFGALLGGALGGLGGALGDYAGKRFEARKGGELLPRNEDADLLRASLSPQDRAVVTRAMEKALADFHADRPVDVSEAFRESEVLGRAYDMVRRDPLGGPADEVLATLSSPEFEKILVERGPALLEENGSITIRDKLFVRQYGSRAWGLVKIIWRHGEMNTDPRPELKVTREDIVMFPRVLREYAPVTEATFLPRSKETRWVIRGEDGVDVIYALARRRKGHEAPTLLTVFRHDQGQYGQSALRTPPESSKRVNSHRSDKTLEHGDTTGGSLPQAPRSQEALHQRAGTEEE